MANMSQRLGSAEKAPAIDHRRLDDDDSFAEIYSMGEKLGSGSFGTVWLVRHKETGQEWACKLINKDKEKAGGTAIKLLSREVAILKEVQHEHIIRLKEVFETSKKMYLIMEFCRGGNLKTRLTKRKRFEEAEVKMIMQRLASAISYLHNKDMVHRDVKLDNVLLNQNPKDKLDDLYVKITDFGLSLKKGGVGYENMMMDFCGTLIYMAPEIIDQKTYSEKCDVWALGVIMYTLLCGSEPFVGRDEEITDAIKNCNISRHFGRDEVWSTVSDQAKNCLCRMLERNPAQRCTAGEILLSPWIKGGDQTPNVLELMKHFNKKEKESAINGDVSDEGDQRDGSQGSLGGASSLEDGATSSEPPSRDSSAGIKKSTGGSRSSSGGTKRTSLPGDKKNASNRGTSRTSLDSSGMHATSSSSNLSGKVSRNGMHSKPAGPGTRTCKSKSPLNKDNQRPTGGGSRGGAGQSYHGSKPQATKTSSGASGSGSSSAGSNKTPATDSVKVKKKISR